MSDSKINDCLHLFHQTRLHQLSHTHKHKSVGRLSWPFVPFSQTLTHSIFPCWWIHRKTNQWEKTLRENIFLSLCKARPVFSVLVNAHFPQWQAFFRTLHFLLCSRDWTCNKKDWAKLSVGIWPEHAAFFLFRHLENSRRFRVILPSLTYRLFKVFPAKICHISNNSVHLM